MRRREAQAIGRPSNGRAKRVILLVKLKTRPFFKSNNKVRIIDSTGFEIFDSEKHSLHGYIESEAASTGNRTRVLRFVNPTLSPLDYALIAKNFARDTWLNL